MGTLVCRIELNKQSGITVSVKNEEGGITQTFVMDGQSITITCAGKENTSTITQQADSVAINCKSFSVKAETIVCHSTDKTTHSSDKTYTINSGDAMSLASKADLVAKSNATAKISGQTVEGEAKQKMSLSAQTVTIEGQQKAEITGMQLALVGKTKAEMKGASVTVKADAAMNVEGQITTLKGSMTAVKGSMITLG